MGDPDLTLIGRHVLEVRDEMRLLRSEVGAMRGEFSGMRDDQTVMIRMLQAREAEIDLMRALEQRYAGLRARMAEFEQPLEKLETAR
jgi:hypothetical protein